VNRSFAVMGVKYPDREEPKKTEKRSKGASGEDPVAKKRKISSADAGSSKATPKVLRRSCPVRLRRSTQQRKVIVWLVTFGLFLIMSYVVNLLCGS